MCQPRDLRALLHTPIKNLPPEIKHNTVLRDTIVAWRGYKKLAKLPTDMSIYNPICNNPTFIPGTLHTQFTTWMEKGLIFFKDLFEKDSPWKPKTFRALQREYSLPDTHYFYYSQVTSYLKGIQNKPHHCFQKTIIDKRITMQLYSIR